MESEKQIMSTCNDICKKFRAIKPVGGIGRYETGQKRCTDCRIFIQFEGLRCPCCGNRLRMSPKSTKNRKYLRDSKGIDY